MQAAVPNSPPIEILQPSAEEWEETASEEEVAVQMNEWQQRRAGIIDTRVLSDIDRPGMQIQEISEDGDMVVAFNQAMFVPDFIT